MLCSKWFICTEPEKHLEKCSNKNSQNKEVDREKILSCKDYNWYTQNEHVKDFNVKDFDWRKLDMPL